MDSATSLKAFLIPQTGTLTRTLRTAWSCVHENTLTNDRQEAEDKFFLLSKDGSELYFRRLPLKILVGLILLAMDSIKTHLRLGSPYSTICSASLLCGIPS